VTTEERPAPSALLCGAEHVATTPHTAGETRRYDRNMIQILRNDLAAFAAAQSNDASRLSEAYRGQRTTQFLPERPDWREATQSAGIGAP
jgi:phosphoglycerate dehydrogenase-like enzyme